jgi:putative SOS response-associated peptidase YedK
MCNHYRNDVRKAGRAFEVYGFDEFSEIRLPQDLEVLPVDVYPDRMGLVVHNDAEGKPAVGAMRWGFPPVEGSFVTNVRNVKSGFWKPWLKPEFRCLVPATAFSEWSAGPPKGERWFAMASNEPMFLAGIWRPWEGVRGTKAKPVEGEHRLFAFLTCPPNGVVAPIHPKAMPVILKPTGARMWLEAPAEIALELQRPLADAELVMEPLAVRGPLAEGPLPGSQGDLLG